MDMIVELVKALAWPTTVLVLGGMFREELRAVLSRITHVKYKDIEAKFDRELQAAEDEAKALPLLPPPGLPPAPTGKPLPLRPSIVRYDHVVRLISVSPRAAITEAWRELELATSRAAKTVGLDLEAGRIAGTRHIRELVQRDVLPKSVLPVYDRLRKLRNEAAHVADFDISVSEAERYIDVANSLTQVLDQIGYKET